jgi:hypothetical protein
MLNMHEKVLNKILKKYILGIVKKEIKHKRRHKYSDEYYLEMFTYVLKHVVSWSSLKFLSSYPSNNENHYKYLNQVFNNWTRHNIFQKAYTMMIQENYFKLNDLERNKKLNLFVDSTYVINSYGIDHKATNPEYKKKKVSKLTTICDKNKNILSVVFDPTHKVKREMIHLAMIQKLYKDALMICSLIFQKIF